MHYDGTNDIDCRGFLNSGRGEKMAKKKKRMKNNKRSADFLFDS